MCGKTAESNISLKSYHSKAFTVEGDFYVTIKEIVLSKKFRSENLSANYLGACVSLETKFGQVFQITKGLPEQQ
jgi:hypothetical protein